MNVKFRISRHPKSTLAHRYRYTMVKGRVALPSEGYPTYGQALKRATALWRGLCAQIAPGAAPLPLPLTRDSYKPRTGAPVHQAKGNKLVSLKDLRARVKLRLA